jgi:thiol-disulfide isomerase/thioredoxin
MKKLILTLLFLATVTARAELTWLTDLDAAKAKGVKENKPVLVDFTGSDWCPPCKQLHKVVFDSAEFAAVASKYVLVELDYPKAKTQTPELKAKNAELSKQFGISGFPTVLLIDAKSGDVFGKTVGFGGQTAKEYLQKLASFKNTPEGRVALEKEGKEKTTRSAKSRELGQKIEAAISVKDFKAAEAALSEIFADVTGAPMGVFHYNKARILLRIDPSAKAEALKYLDEALKVSAGDAGLTKTFQSYRDKVSGGASAPKSAADPKKGA